MSKRDGRGSFSHTEHQVCATKASSRHEFDVGTSKWISCSLIFIVRGQVGNGSAQKFSGVRLQH